MRTVIEAVAGFSVIPSLLPACSSILLDKFTSVAMCMQSPNLDVYAGMYVTALIDVFEKCVGDERAAEETAYKSLIMVLDIAKKNESEIGSVFAGDRLMERLKRLVVVLTTLVSEVDRATVLESRIVPFFTTFIDNRSRSGIVLFSSIYAACPANQAGIVDCRLVDDLVLLVVEHAGDEMVLASIAKLVASLLNKCQDGL